MSTHPRTTLAVLGLFTVVLALFITRMDVELDAEAFAPDSEVREALDLVRDEFGGGDTERLVQVVVDGGTADVTTPDGVELAGMVTDALRSADRDGRIDLAPGTDGIASFATPLSGTPSTRPTDGRGVDAALSRVLDDPEVGSSFRLLLSRDLDDSGGELRAHAGLIVVQFAETVDEDRLGDQADTVDAIVDSLEAQAPPGYDLATFGERLLVNEIDRLSSQELPRLMAIGLVLLTIILFLTYRNTGDVVIGLVGVVVAVIWMLGTAVILGPRFLGIIGPFTTFTLNTPIVLLGLAIDYGIQLTVRYREETSAGRHPRPAANIAIGTVGAALVLTSFTTMAGFLSNLSSPLPPIRDFGIVLAAGALSAFVVMAALIPATRQLRDQWRLHRPRPRRDRGMGTDFAGPLIGRVSAAAATHAWPVVIVVGGLAVAAAVAATQIGAFFAEEDFVPPDSEIRQSLDLVIDRFGGDLAEETFVVVRGDVDDPRVGDGIDTLLAEAGTIEDVRGDRGGAVAEVRTDPERDTIVVALSTTAGGARVGQLRDALEARAGSIGSDRTDVVVTSSRIVSDDVNSRLTDSGKRSIAVALLAALVIMVTYYTVFERHPVVGVLTVVSAAIVVALTLGTMWALGVSFNIATVTIASIAIGIGIDYSIHMTHRFVEELGDSHEVAAAVTRAGETTGGALLSSATTTVAGLGVLAFSALTPMSQFGTITAAAIALAFLGSIVVQPALLALWDRYR